MKNPPAEYPRFQNGPKPKALTLHALGWMGYLRGDSVLFSRYHERLDLNPTDFALSPRQ
jgi:hypothetical protein